MGNDLEKDVENKINENRKFHAVLLVTILILLFILAFVIKLANDKKQEIISVVDNNNIVVNNEEIRNEVTNNDEIKDNEIIQDVVNSEFELENKLKDYKADPEKEIIFIKDSIEGYVFDEGTGKKDELYIYELLKINLKFKEIEKINSRIEDIYNENKVSYKNGEFNSSRPILDVKIEQIEDILDLTIYYNNAKVTDINQENYHIDIEKDEVISNKEYLNRLGIGKENLEKLIDNAFLNYQIEFDEKYENYEDLKNASIFIKDKNMLTEKYKYDFDKICKISEISYVGDNRIFIDNIAVPMCFGTDYGTRFGDEYIIGIEIDISELINDKKIEYKPFIKDVVDNKKNGEYIELVEIIANKDNTVTLNLRKYTKSEVPELTEVQYNELIKNNEIELFNETFSYNPRVNVLTNNKYVSFELDKENRKLTEYPMTILCTGTDEYYTITCNSDLKVYNDVSEDAFETILQYANRSQQDDYDLLSISIIPEYVFNDNDELERINVIF